MLLLISQDKTPVLLLGLMPLYITPSLGLAPLPSPQLAAWRIVLLKPAEG